MKPINKRLWMEMSLVRMNWNKASIYSIFLKKEQKYECKKLKSWYETTWM